MNLEPLNIPQLLRANGLVAQKGLGQNFLSDPGILEKVVESADLHSWDHVLEIGPGLGSLTRVLAARCKQVTAVEIDKNLIPILQQVLHGTDNVRVVHADILTLNPREVMKGEPYSVVANIPYYITSAILRHLLDSNHKPEKLILTVQKEVAERICAAPGDMSLLALSVQVFGTPKTVLRIPAGAFYPPPNVDSVTVRIDALEQPLIVRDKLDIFFHLARAGFSQKRKSLRNSLTGGLAWETREVEDMLRTAGIDLMRRAETLTMSEWSRLTDAYPLP